MNLDPKMDISLSSLCPSVNSTTGADVLRWRGWWWVLTKRSRCTVIQSLTLPSLHTPPWGRVSVERVGDHAPTEDDPWKDSLNVWDADDRVCVCVSVCEGACVVGAADRLTEMSGHWSPECQVTKIQIMIYISTSQETKITSNTSFLAFFPFWGRRDRLKW